jgi:hypothetical protein
VSSTEEAAGELKRHFFTTGQSIPVTGIYRVRHDSHRLPSECTLLKGQQFPRCANCGDRVVFELLHEAPDVFSDPDFKVALYELPELRVQEAEEPDLKRVV